MKKFYAFLAVIFFTIYTNAQPTNSNISSNSDNTKTVVQKSSDDKDKTDADKSKINLPPEKANPVKIGKITAPMVIDGRLDEDMWKTAAVFKDFIQTGPGDNIAPSKPTEAYLAYDERNLYIGFKCWDERDKIRATVAKRDEVFGEDNVRVWLDTYNDQRRAYVLGWNPLGIQQDGIFTEGQGADFSVDIVMESKGVIEDWGWSVEVKIPFKSLRYAAGKGKMWGFNAAREIDRLNNEFDSWMPDDRNVSGFLIKHGKISGLDEIKTERTLEIVPSITIGETGRRTRTIPRFLVLPGSIDPGRFVNQNIEQDIGVNIKYSITPNITLDATYNPDFAEIEADAPVVSANQRFPIFFQEKRPFFLEGADSFQTPIFVFNSRAIIDPDIAAKLTGKIGKTSFGFLAASDKAPGNYDDEERSDPFIRPRINEFLDRNALFGVLRIKRDIGKENSLGFVGTYRSFPEQRNLLGGFDGKFKLDPKTVFTFHVVGTHSRRCFFEPTFEPSLEAFQAQRNRDICGGSTFNRYRTGNGLAYFANYDHTEKNRGFSISVLGRSKDYRADAGFTRRVNTNNIDFGLRLSTEPNPKGKIIRVNWFNGVGINYNWQGLSQDVFWNSGVNLSLQRSTFVNINGGLSYERVFEQEFGLRRSPFRSTGAFSGEGERSANQGYASINLNSSPSKRYNFGVFVGTIFNAFDFDFGGGNRYPRVSPVYLAYLQELLINPNAPEPPLDPGAGRQFDFGLGFELKPIDPLRFSLEYNKSKLKRNDTGLTAFDANIFTVRSTYQFTRFTFTRLRLDYDTLSSNVSGQFLVGWNPNPGTAFYVGYNDNFNYNGFSPFTGQLEPRFERNSRTFFIRASYLFRKSF
jgi:hypothetical protein